MKVFLLQYYDAHDVWTQGAYSSLELALKYHEENEDWGDGWAACNIQELEVIEE